MRNYQGLVIPDRELRNGEDIKQKQAVYCSKSDCVKDGISCNRCLFYKDNMSKFEQWYLNKNKKVKT